MTYSDNPGHLPLIATALTPAVTGVQGAPGDLLANAIRRNVALNVEKLMATGPILKSFLEDKMIRIVGGVYELTSGRVELIWPSSGSQLEHRGTLARTELGPGAQASRRAPYGSTAPCSAQRLRRAVL
jgi:hypothetical protein